MEIHQKPRKKADFKQPVDESEMKLQLAIALAGEQITSVHELDTGLFNNTYLVSTSNNAYILKVAPGQQTEVLHNEKFLMQREHAISGFLQAVSPLVPEYLSFFKIGDREAFLQAFIEGQLWYDVAGSLSEHENSVLWRQLGEFARTAHQWEGKSFGYPAPFAPCSTWSDFIKSNVEGLLGDCVRNGVFYPEVQEFQLLLPGFYGVLDEVNSARLLHGDLWPRNVIIGGKGSDIHIKAVIDGERAYWGDPISDWVLILYDLPEVFWLGYGQNLLESSDPIKIAIYKGMYFVVNILETLRFSEPDQQYRDYLSGINAQLRKSL